MSSPSKSHHGFRNAIRIRRNSGASTSCQQQQPQPTERGPFELQVVERAVRDEQDEITAAAAADREADGRQSPEQQKRCADDYQGRRGSAPDTYDSRPQYSRRPSLLEQLVRQDRQSVTAAPQQNSASSSKGGNETVSASGTGQTPPSFSRLSNPRSRDTNTDGTTGLGVLHEGDENISSTATSAAAYRSRASSQSAQSSYGQGATLSPTFSAPLRSRPEMVHLGPSSDRVRGLAPGPRLLSASTRQDRPWQPDQQQTTSHGAEPSGSSSEGEDKRTQTPTSQNQVESKPGIFSSLMRRGRSYTLPSLRRTTTGERPESRQGASPKQHQRAAGDDGVAHDDRADDGQEDADMHEDGVVDYLDVVDAEVGVLNHMSNIQNSIFIPHIPALYDRRTTHALPASNSAAANRVAARRRSRVSQDSSAALEEGRLDHRQSPAPGSVAGDATSATTRPGMLTRMTSAMSFTTSRKKTQDPEAFNHFSKWAEMDETERHELDEHVQFLLTRPQKFRRGLRGFGKWAMTPMGFIMLCYGIAITGWGIVIMLFIWKWINLHDPVRQRWWIEICDQVLCALFAAVGLGFAPFRAVDTWRMCHIAHYHHLSWKRRKQFNLPKLDDPNDLPRPKGYNEAFPPPAPLDLITEEDSEILSPGTTTRSGSGWNLNANASGPSLGARSSREEGSELEDRSPYEGRTPGSLPMSSRGNSSIGGGGADAAMSPGTRSRSSTTTAGSLRPSALAQAISNANPPTSHRWWQIRSKQDKEQSKHAAEAAMQAVESVSPLESSQSVDQQPHHRATQDTQTTSSGHNEKSEPRSGNGGPPQSRPQLRGGQAPPLERNVSIISELEKEREDVVVLTPEEQAKLNHHQRKFHQSHTFYRYHETATHRAFPLDLMIVIVCLLDCHSLLQGSLGGVTWGIRYHNRPTALTASLITCSLSCNAVAGFLIYLGGRRTKKTEEVQRRLRIALEEEAYRDILLGQKRREEEEEMRKVLDGAVLSAPVSTHRKGTARGSGGRAKSQTHSQDEQRKNRNQDPGRQSDSPTGSTRALI